MTSSNETSQSDHSVLYRRMLEVIFRVMIYLPWIWFLLLGTFVLGVTLQVGHLPSYGQPDPKDAGAISILYMPVMVVMFLVLGVSLFGIGLAILKLWQDIPSWIRKGEVILYLVGIGLFFLFITNDIAGLMTWLAD